MDKELRNHTRYMSETLQHKDLSSIEIERLAAYHKERVHDFQHERLVHLLVTFFFAVLLLLFTAGYFVVLFLFSFGLLHWLLLSAILLLLVVVLFYVFHYYKLENGTQKLYEFTQTLYNRNK